MTGIRSGLLLAIALSTLLVPALRAAEPPGRYALMIGITKYQHAEMNRRPLEFPETDARDLGKLLADAGYEVEYLLGRSATLKAIHAKLDALAEKGESDGVALIGLFGHGEEIPTFDKEGKPIVDARGQPVTEGCFCPYDTKIRLATDSQGNQLFNDKRSRTECDPDSLLKMAKLMIKLGVAQAGHRVVIADCCRTIPDRTRSRSFGASFETRLLPSNTAVLFACSSDEEAHEHKDWQHGAFTKCLLDELAEMSTVGKVRTSTLLDRLIESVPELVSTKSNDRQTPTLFATGSIDLKLDSVLIRFECNKAGELREFCYLKIKFRWCPAGTYKMGSPASDTEAYDDEKPQVDVTLSRGFWLGQTEVTQGEWTRVMGTTPWKDQFFVKEGANYPAVYVSRDDASTFCDKLTARERAENRLPLGWKYRLPSEAEWEYACRAGTRTKYCFGDDEGRLSDYAVWFDKKRNGGDAMADEYALSVGRKKPNAWGLYDMHGNVQEWCADVYVETLPGGRNPLVDFGSSYPVHRGGGWYSSPLYLRSARRNRSSNVSDRSHDLGFRLVLSPSRE